MKKLNDTLLSLPETLQENLGDSFLIFLMWVTSREKKQMYSRFRAPTDNGTGISSTAVTSTNQQWISETWRSLTKETSLLLMEASISFYGTSFKQGKATKPESWHPVLLLDVGRLHEAWQNLSCSYPLVLPPSKQDLRDTFDAKRGKFILTDPGGRSGTPRICTGTARTQVPFLPTEWRCQSHLGQGCHRLLAQLQPLQTEHAPMPLI